MAKFGAGETTVSQTPNFVSPKQGVEDKSTALAIAGFGDVFLQAASAISKNSSNSRLADFTNRQLAIVQGVDQGKYKSAFGRSMLRKNLIQAINDHPSLREDLIKTNAQILGTAGMGDVVTQGTKEEQRVQGIKDNLVKNGLVSPNATDDQYNKAYKNWRLAQESQRRLKETMDTIALEKAKAGLTKAKKDALDAQASSAAVDYLTGVAPAEMDHYDTWTKQLQQQVANGDITQAQALQAMDTRWADFQQGISKYTAMISGHQADALTKAFQMRHEANVKFLTGEYNNEEYKRKIDQATNFYTMLAMKDPRIAKGAAMSKIMPRLPYDGLQDLNAAVGDFFSTNSQETDTPANPFSKDEVTRKALKKYLNGVSDSVDPNDPGQVKEQGVHLANILSGVEDFESVVKKDPTKAKELTAWFASPSFLKLAQKHPEMLGNLSTVHDIIQADYADQVWGVVKREFRDSKVVVGSHFATDKGGSTPTEVADAKPASALVQAISNKDGVTFEPIDPANNDAVLKAQQLNREVKPVINTTVRAVAHLSGRTDYGKVFEESSSAILGGGETQPQQQSQETGGAALTIEDFSQGKSDLPMYSKFMKGNIDFSNATKPMDIAQAFIGANEKKEGAVLDAFIKQATGGVIDVKTTPWCAAFVNGVLATGGKETTGKLNARSFLDWGTPTDTPKTGDVVVLWRDSPDSWKGHVGFYAGPGEKDGYIKILGGNQGDSVSIKEYPADRVLGYRRG